jgi:predicted heme/steroid binding protein
MSKEMQIFTVEQVAAANTEAKSWIIIDSSVYDISRFAAMHPGGELILREYAGKEATEIFYSFHRQEVLDKYARLKIGSIKDTKPKILWNKGISLVPYAEPSYMQGFNSPYYKESHHALRKTVREFLKTHAYEEGLKGEDSGEPASKELMMKFGSAGILAGRMGPGPHLASFESICGVPVAEYDYFHEMILHEEFSNLGLPGFQDSLGTGMVIGLSPVINFAKKEVKARVVPQILSGQERICLAITEPSAGSDVAAIKTTAVKSADGKFYIVNGCKKWITNGADCKYFTTAVVTDKGISMLLVERAEGLETKVL